MPPPTRVYRVPFHLNDACSRVRRQSLYATCKIAVVTLGRTKVARSVKWARRNRYRPPGTGCRARLIVQVAASLGSLFAVPETFIECLEEIFGRVRNNRTGRKNCLSSSLHQGLIVLRRDHASDNDHDVVSTLLGQFRL